MSTIIKQFYLRVREVYNTVSEFFQKVDIDGSKTISREEFVTLVKNLRLNFNSTELNSIWIQLDKSNNGKVFPLNFRTIFTPFIDEDMRNLLMDLYRCLDNQGITFGELIKAYNKGGYIAFARLMDALKSISKNNFQCNIIYIKLKRSQFQSPWPEFHSQWIRHQKHSRNKCPDTR